MVSIIFQDLVRYDFMLKQNIAVGNISRVEDDPAIKAAAERSLPTRWPSGSRAGTTRCWASRLGWGGSLGWRVAEGGAGAGVHAMLDQELLPPELPL